MQLRGMLLGRGGTGTWRQCASWRSPHLVPSAGMASKARRSTRRKRGSKLGTSTVYLPEGDVSLSQLAWLTQIPEAALTASLDKIGGKANGVVREDDVKSLALDLGLTTRAWSEMPLRAPIVTVMGHVDHGKTTLLDTLRKTSVAAAEAGAITQHIGAFSVDMQSSGQAITFLDTPGHSAFEAMRERGAVVTDIVVLVVAADDSVQPQTIEAAKHASRAGVPIVVAVNKCDLPDANPERVLGDLASMDPPVLVEELGGEVMSVNISALEGSGMEELEETIMLQAELMELRADPDCAAEGVVVEARLDRGLGPVATVLVKRGTLRRGEYVAAGMRYGRVKAMVSADGGAQQDVGPGVPVQLVGLKGCPEASDQLRAFSSEAQAKQQAAESAEQMQQARQRAEMGLVAERREAHDQMHEAQMEVKPERIKGRLKKHEFAKFLVERESARMARASASTPLRAWGSGGGAGSGAGGLVEEGEHAGKQEVLVLVKADVQGSVEAVADSLDGLATEHAVVRVLRAAVGAIGPGDVSLAALNDPPARVVGFSVGAAKGVGAMAEREGVSIETSPVIYDLIDGVKETLASMGPSTREVVMGRADILKVFHLRGKLAGTVVAGCRIAEGTLKHGEMAKVLRRPSSPEAGGEGLAASEMVCVGRARVGSLNLHDTPVSELSDEGTECGLSLDGFDAFVEGDVVEIIEEVEATHEVTSA